LNRVLRRAGARLFNADIGEPGIGKSTIIIQAAANIARQYAKYYMSPEKNPQTDQNAGDRVCKGLMDNLFLLAETNMENIVQVVEELKPEFLIIDSIQTMYSDEMESAPGSVSQVRACGND
jgi:DNA repair protein RadA/Sms